jgi:hypothetical protein
VHRDLKPGNIFLSADGPIKLLDFGVAQLRERGAETTRSGTAFGTPSFMAPEQAMGKVDQLDARADVFAMGATLHVSVSGKRLWHGKSAHEAYLMAATQPAPSLARTAPELPIELIALVDRALQWDRRNRFQSAVEMRDAIRALLAKLEEGALPLDPLVAAPTRGSGLTTPTPSRHPATHPRILTPTVQRYSPSPTSVRPVSAALRMSRPPSTPIGERPLSMPPMSSHGGAPSVLEWDGIKREDVFRRFDRLLKAIRHYGPAHPEAASKVHGVHEAVLSVLRTDPEGLCWEIQPYCFARAGEPEWEPEHPADVIPYNLYASGLKRVQLLPGLPEDELRTFCEIITRDPVREGESVDLAGALWDAGLTKILLEITDDLTGFDATEEEGFWAETNEVEHLVRDGIGANIDASDDAAGAAYADALSMVLDPDSMLGREEVAEAVAMAMSVQGKAEGPTTGADALRLDLGTSTALLAELTQPPERWRERFLDIAIDALADAGWRGDEALVWSAFAAQARRLLRAADPDGLFALYGGLLTRISPYLDQPEMSASLVGVTSAIFQGPVLEWVVKLAMGQALGQLTALQAPDDATRARALETLRTIAELLDASGCADGVRLADGLPEGEPLELLLKWLGRHVPGEVRFFADEVHRLGPRLAHRVLDMLVRCGSHEGLAVVRALRTSANPSLRCEALALTAESHELLKDQLLEMIEALDVSLRAAALSTMVRHQVRAAGPGLVRIVESDGFRNRPIDVQRELLTALYALHARRAETILCALIRQHGLMKDEALDRTRTLAAELLGEWGDGEETLAALEEAQTRRWWNSAELRDTARVAADRIGARRRASRTGPTTPGGSS